MFSWWYQLPCPNLPLAMKSGKSSNEVTAMGFHILPQTGNFGSKSFEGVKFTPRLIVHWLTTENSGSVDRNLGSEYIFVAVVHFALFHAKVLPGQKVQLYTMWLHFKWEWSTLFSWTKDRNLYWFGIFFCFRVPLFGFKSDICKRETNRSSIPLTVAERNSNQIF